MAGRPRNLLRRQRRLRHHGRRLRLRQPLQPGVRREHGGAEHGAVQQRVQLRRVLRDKVRRRQAVVPRRQPLHLHHRHQLLPPQLRPPQRQRRLVQPSPHPLRPRHAHVPQNRRVPRRHRPRQLPEGALQEARRDKVHDQRLPLLQPGSGHQRRGCRGYREGEHQGDQDRVAEHEPELGAKLAIQLHPGGPAPLLPRHRQRPPHLHLVEHRSGQLAVRADIRGEEFPGLKHGMTDLPLVISRFEAVFDSCG